jgi:hypothetical protein
MDPTHSVRDLAALFREAGRAHHQAFIATNGDDPDWPCWYAKYLSPKLVPFLGVRLTNSELAQMLDEVEERRKTESPAADWPDFYAELFLARVNA